MSSGSFAHLHVHTEYSMLDGASRVEELVAAAASDGQPAVGITDHGNMYGVLPFYKACKAHDVTPVIGCLLPGQEIVTANGVRPVEEIEVGDLVLTHRGRMRRVTRTMRRRYSGRGYEVVLAGRATRTLTLTEEHPILVRDRQGNLTWAKPGDIDGGRQARNGKTFGRDNWRTWACLPKLHGSNVVVDVLRHLPSTFVSDGGGLVRLPTRPFESEVRWPVAEALVLTEDLAYVLGLYVAEGSAGHRADGALNGDICFSFHADEVHLAERVVEQFSWWGGNPRLYFRDERTLLEVRVGLLPIAHLFAGMAGSGAKDKRVPVEILEAPGSVRRAFLEGVLDGDGKNPERESNRTGARNLKTASAHLAWGVRTLLAAEGHWVSVSTGTATNNSGTESTWYQVTYNPERAYSRTLEDDEFVYRPILEVRPVDIESVVYNFEVEDDNSYVSDFVLHNCELYMAHDSRHERVNVRGKLDDTGGEGDGGKKAYYHLTVLAETNEGYRNLIQLSSRAFMEGYYRKPKVDWEVLADHSRGVIATTGCLGGHVLQSLLADRFDEALEKAGRLQEIFGRDNLFVELQDHGIPEQHRTNPQLVDIARRIGAPLLATNDSHYTKPEDAESHDALLCVQTGALISQTGDERFKFKGHGHYLRTAAEMRHLFDELPSACDNSLWIAERANVEIEFGKPKLPRFPVPEGFADNAAYLHHLTMEGARERWGQDLPDHVVERLAYELKVIGDMGFAAYFLIVWDLIRHAREHGIRVGPGRGSAAGCAVAYCLRITDLDPIRYDLLFERFLNPSRISMPDIDMDFDSRYRDEMIRYAAQMYGRDHVAQIVTFGTIKARQAVQDAARVLGYDFQTGLRISKAMPPLVMGRDTPLYACLEKHDKYEDGYKMAAELRAMYDAEPEVKRVVDVAKGLEGMRRSDGIHAAAVVITRDPLTEYLPIQRKPSPNQDPDEAPVVTQFEMGGVEELGLLKMDFLGLRNLDVITDAIEMIRSFRGVELDIDAIPLDDDPTLALLRRGDSIGVFQLEGGPMRSLMRSLAPTSFDDVAALVALYRPGPMAANMHNDYADRKNGRKPVSYFHPDAEELLADTYGLMIYQEAVMRVAQRFAGYSLAQADSLRKAMGKKSREVMAKEKAAFLEGCSSTGYDEKLGAELFGIIEQFADYAFNKSHSYGYGLIAYQTAYLKAHFPVEYFAALLTSVKGSLEKAAVYLAECRAIGIKVLTPDVNRSASDFVAARVDDGKGGIEEVIPFGLSAVRNVGSGLVELILAERDAKGPFRDFYDFCDRVDLQVLNKRTIESLIKAGAFDAVGHPRKGLLAVFEGIIDKTTSRRREYDMGVMTLFGDAADAGGMSFDDRSEIPDVEFDKRDRLAFEKEMLGLYVSDHPLMGAEGALRRKTDGTLADAAEVEEGAIKSYGGVITALNRKWTRAGDLMAVFALEDLSSQMEVMVFPKTMSVIGHKLADDAVVIVKGRLDKRDDQPKLIAMDVEVFEGITDGAPPVRIEVPASISDQLAARLHALISEHPGDSEVFLHTGRQVVKLPDRFNVDAASGFLGEVRVLLGADCLL